jgi:hypothetical protein
MGEVFWKRLQVVLSITALAGSIAWYSLWDHYVRTRPATMNSEAGRVIPLHSHGLVVYLTTSERQKLRFTNYAATVAAILAVLIYVAKDHAKK